MAEIRINATGGVKLYDADDSHYAQIIAGTITSNTDVMTLGHNVIDIPMTTASSSATTGALTIGGGLGVAADLYIGDDTYLITDSAVLGFGADKDTTLTHTDGTGLTLNSTNKLCFNDATQFVQGISGTVLGLGATDEIDLTATTVDLNGTLNVSGVATFQAAPVFPNGSLDLLDLDIDGGTDIGAAIVDADLFIVDDGAGGTNRKVAASRLKTYAGGANTPAFQAGLSSSQSITQDTSVKITFDTELFDSDGTYDNSTNYRFTPAVVGKYYVYANARYPVSTDFDNFQMSIRKNGTDVLFMNRRHLHYGSMYIGGIVDSDADDYFEAFIYQDTGGSINVNGLVIQTYFGGFKVIT